MWKCGLPLLAIGLLAGLAFETALGYEPIKLHPENPHYFLFRGKPTVLITSGEHYGAVLNREFEFVRYLDELHARGFNQTRTFSGVFPELPASFGIPANTLSPAPGRYLCPWARSATPGAFDGGNKFDLSKWDEAYFRRLGDFVAEAGKRGVVVELVLFNTLYGDELWNACPLNAKNNVNGIGDVPRNEVWSLKHPALVAVQDAMIRKIVESLKDFDNLYYEGCNEPYERGLPTDWQDHVTDTISAAEGDFSHKHLIAQNVGNGLMPITKPHRAVSVFNYHYASPPDSARRHFGLNRVIAFDETGGRGRDDLPYRTDAWSFLLAGGAVYSNLDFSFSVRSPEGKEREVPSQSGGGQAIRGQLEVLKEFMQSLDFLRMAPDTAFIKGGVPPGAGVQALAEPGKAYAVYLHLNHKSSARWTGRLVPNHTGATTFSLLCNDGARLYIDGRLVVDHWSDYAGSNLVAVASGKANLIAGEAVDLKVEYYDRGGIAYCRLTWSGQGLKEESIPEEQFQLPDGKGHGLKGEYYEGSGFETLRMSRTDGTINVYRPDGSLTLFPDLLKKGQVDLTLDLPRGDYRAEWVNTKSGKVDRAEEFNHAGGTRSLSSPGFAEDIALRVRQAVHADR